jgi:hypothetical protein
MRDFTVSGYLIGIDGNRLILKVIDEDIDRISIIKTFHKKNDQLGNFIAINCKHARYDISNLDWKETTDLIGVLLTIYCTTRNFAFRKKIGTVATSRVKGTRDSYIPESIPMTLVSFQAKTIKN